MKFTLLLLLPLSLFAQGLFGQNYDLVIRNGHIIDGTGSPWYAADIAIRDGHIAAIGHLDSATAKQTIDAAGMVVAPGFIDMLGQSEESILVNPHLPSKIYQGITTEITGEGGSAAPLNDAIVANDGPGYEHFKINPDWRTFRQYFARLEKQGMGINLASYVGATQVRRMVLGDADVQPTSEQLEKMKVLVREAMRDGAVGVSTSLEYAPAPYAKTEEIIALASEASKFGGIYATHMRNESDSVLEAIDEAVRIGREARKDMETPSKDWDNEWVEISGPQDVMIGVVQNPALKNVQGKRLAEVAKIMNKDPMDALFDILIEDKAFTECAVFGMSEPDVVLALQQPWVSVDNDSSGTSPKGILGEEHPHPRAYGTFPRILRKYVREEKKLTLEEAIRKFSALPAQRMRLTDRGVLKQGMWADMVIFDPGTVHDIATFDDPNRLSEGMEYVLVNGVPVIENGKMTGALPGKVLRGAGYVP